MSKSETLHMFEKSLHEINKPSPRVIHAMIIDLADRLERSLRPGFADANGTHLRDIGKIMQQVDIGQAEWLREVLLEFAEKSGWLPARVPVSSQSLYGLFGSPIPKP